MNNTSNTSNTGKRSADGGGSAAGGSAGGGSAERAGWQVSWVAETGSTNADLKQLASQSRNRGQLSGLDGTVLAAEHQTQGRGRLGRSWESPPGENLLFSVLLCPRCEPKDFAWLTQLAALAVADACVELSGRRAQLKWPNDVVVAGKKLAGILAEVVLGSGSAAEAVVLGVGLNVNWPTAQVSGEFRLEATSLAQLVASDAAGGVVHAVESSSQPLDPKAVLDVVLARLRQRLELLERSGWQEQLRQLVKDNSATLGQDVVAELAQESIVGKAVDITDTGALMVERSGSPQSCDTLPQRVEISAGDVVHATHA